MYDVVLLCSFIYSSKLRSRQAQRASLRPESITNCVQVFAARVYGGPCLIPLLNLALVAGASLVPIWLVSRVSIIFSIGPMRRADWAIP